MVFDSCGVSELQRSMFATPELTLWEGYPSVFCIRSFKFRIQGHVGSRMFQVFTQYTIYIYIPGKPYGHFFLSIMGFTRNGRFLCSIAYFVF